jgi:NADH-quinone oxidoreductase subunit K
MIVTNLNLMFIISSCLFVIGILGLVFNRKNILIIIISIELMLLAINLNFVIFSIYLDDSLGQLFVLFILTVAAAESSIGLAILIAYYKIKGTINIERLQTTKI